jgi:microcompartment protein CcmK/EutM
VQAGIGSRVLVTQSGSAGAELTGEEMSPFRSVIVGIIDEETSK